jgi:hypothetical protein
MTARVIVAHGRAVQIVTTTYEPDPAAKDGVHEHVTLETPTPLTEAQRLRLESLNETGKFWRP